MGDQRVQELEMKVAFMERHLEEMDKAVISMNEQLRDMNAAIERIAAQQSRTQGPGGEESAEDAVPPHY